MPDIEMVRHGGILVPLNPEGAQIIAALDENKPIKCKVRNPRETRRDILNRLSHAIYNEAARLMGDTSPEDEKAYCKYHYGIPILIHDPEDGEECEDYYRRLLSGLSYEDRIARMHETHRFYVPVTSLFTDQQMHRYVTRCIRHYAEDCGIVILTPKEKQWLSDPEMQRG